MSNTRKRVLELTISDVIDAVNDNARLDAEKVEAEARDRRFRAYNDGVIKSTPVSFFVLGHKNVSDVYFVNEGARDAAYDRCVSVFTKVGMQTAVTRIFKKTTMAELTTHIPLFREHTNAKLQEKNLEILIAHECSKSHTFQEMRAICVTWRDKMYWAYASDATQEEGLCVALTAALDKTYPQATVDVADSVLSMRSDEILTFVNHADKIVGETERILAALANAEKPVV